MKRLLLLHCFRTGIEYPEVFFSVIQCEGMVTIRIDEKNYVEITLKNQQVTYKTDILGGFSHSEKIFGEINYKRFFRIEWPNDQSVPELVFYQTPTEIKREYKKRMNIEFGIEDVRCYHVVYKDDVIAKFIKRRDHSYDFVFSTGFDGNFWKDPDGSHLIRFKGLRHDAEMDDYQSESKFIISRSKFTDNLILILREDATVYLG